MFVATLLLALAPAHAEDAAVAATAVTTATVASPLLPVSYLSLDALAAADDSVDDDDAPEGSVRAEKEDVKKSKSTSDDDDDNGKTKRRVIKTIQKKTFLKLGRAEVGPTVGFVANDPFLNRYIINGIFDYHLTEVFAFEAQLGYAPILGSGGESDPDWKPLSKQLLLENSVSPDISKLTVHGNVGLAYSPIYGKAAVGHKIIVFDIYGAFGLGIVQTSDDLVALQATNDPAAIATQNQWHPTTTISVGTRIAFSPTVAVRLEGKSMSYIETVNSTTLEMKNNFIVQGGVTFFFPGMK